MNRTKLDDLRLTILVDNVANQGERAKQALRDALGDGYLPMQVGLELRIDHAGGLAHARLPA